MDNPSRYVAVRVGSLVYREAGRHGVFAVLQSPVALAGNSGEIRWVYGVFAKSVGAKVFGSSEAKAASADDLKKEAEKLGLDTSKINIQVDGDKVTVAGEAVSTEEAEKIALAVGNTQGVATVDNQLAAA